MSFSGDVQDEIVFRGLLGVAGSFDRDNTHGWWPVSSLARSFIRSIVGRSLARSSTGSFSRSLGRSVALSLVVSAPRSPLRSTARPLCFFSALLFRCIRSALLFRVSLLMHSMIVFCASAGQTKRGFVSHSAVYAFHNKLD